MLLANIPVNLITGFLGSGKTSFIKRLLEQKPEGERWAVLVNEFGEIGLDGALLGQADGVSIREVPGGCLCCAAGVPTQVAIAQLLRKAKPHRLLIEPTGLGHPDKILAALQNDEYRDVLKVHATVCLVDPRNLNDSRYTGHELFNQQLLVADLVLASKADCYDDMALSNLKAYLDGLGSDALVLPHSTANELGEPLLRALSTPPAKKRGAKMQNASAPAPAIRGVGAIQAAQVTHATQVTHVTQAQPVRPIGLKMARSLFDAPDTADEVMDFNEQGFSRKTHESDGFFSCGWCFSPDWRFDFDALLAVCDATPTLRLKAVMITADGILAINRLEETLSLSELDDAMDSRIEFISRTPLDWDALERQLTAATDGGR
ncbi:GTP-binding protein [Shewanella sp. JM162201]|uniref:GTP-binding protein n=1 Tax=Shewanella jiangmenensis TaxID=2837387 RepID=A0ABS5V2H4_9GAMM|nr:GTP-binding protein [Shewanella jiangmenensis]MBT1443263.1 GTP-binding protein [Shewanella jiangmenensis]